jgi:excinuclease ABC subunit A
VTLAGTGVILVVNALRAKHLCLDGPVVFSFVFLADGSHFMQRFIEIHGARTHNLKGIDARLPREQLTVITGPSGSGKSSLAFDTLYAEGRRRYVESLSAYARQFLDRLPKPDVDSIDGLSPAIAIEQRSGAISPRSTVGTVTEILDYLRVLYARAGEPHCPSCGKVIRGFTPVQMVDEILSLPAGTRLSICAPLDLGATESVVASRLAAARKSGFERAQVNGALVDITPGFVLPVGQNTVDVFVDRIQIGTAGRSRVSEAVERALRLAEGTCRMRVLDGKDFVRCERATCLACDLSLPELTPRLFSFNHPDGACPACSGLGSVSTPDLSRIVRPRRALVEGAIDCFAGTGMTRRLKLLCEAARACGIDATVPFGSLPADQQAQVLEGQVPGLGVLPELRARRRNPRKAGSVERYFTRTRCAECKGSRLSKYARAVQIAGKNLSETCALTVAEARRHFESLTFPQERAPVAERILTEVLRRLRFLEGVGLSYLSIDRSSASLSGGEIQRIRLATQVGSGLAGALFVLDEPSVGLHPRDTGRLLATLRSLCEQGNTVVVVEHDTATILAADHVVDMGPGAGREGGRVVAAGTPAEIAQNPDSLTGRYLCGRESVPIPARRRRPSSKALTVVDAHGNNLKHITAAFPVRLFTCVTGVSGSGKSSLVVDTLYAAAARALHRRGTEPGAHSKLEGIDSIARVLCVDQAPIGRTPRANPGSYVGALGPIRTLFAGVPEARARGYRATRFSFNAKGGRCESCQGDGAVKVEMHFLPDLYVPCAECGGTRFDRETLDIKYRGHSIAGVLQMTVNEAAEVFGRVPRVARPLAALQEVGLGYVQLGQSATTLSGGEAQRVRLARELARPRGLPTLYVLDEPTTGLHAADVARLLGVLHRLCDGGHTVVVIEHNLDVIRASDWVIDMGPDGGDRGGEIVAEGTPEALAKNPRSITGRYLREVLRSPLPAKAGPAKVSGITPRA